MKSNRVCAYCVRRTKQTTPRHKLSYQGAILGERSSQERLVIIERVIPEAMRRVGDP